MIEAWGFKRWRRQRGIKYRKCSCGADLEKRDLHEEWCNKVMDNRIAYDLFLTDDEERRKRIKRFGYDIIPRTEPRIEKETDNSGK